MLKFRLDNLTHFVQHHNDSVPPKLVQLFPDVHSHIFGLYSCNLVTDQDKINALMETIGNSLYTEEFEHQDGEKIDKKFLLEASSTFPLVAYKWKFNITLYNVDSAMTNYFYHNDDQV